MNKGFTITQVGGGLLAIMVLGVCLPILDPFLTDGIAATGGITSYLLMAVPFVLVVAVLLYMFKEPAPMQARW